MSPLNQAAVEQVHGKRLENAHLHLKLSSGLRALCCSEMLWWLFEKTSLFGTGELKGFNEKCFYTLPILREQLQSHLGGSELINITKRRWWCNSWYQYKKEIKEREKVSWILLFINPLNTSHCITHSDVLFR